MTQRAFKEALPSEEVAGWHNDLIEGFRSIEKGGFVESTELLQWMTEHLFDGPSASLTQLSAWIAATEPQPQQPYQPAVSALHILAIERLDVPETSQETSEEIGPSTELRLRRARFHPKLAPFSLLLSRMLLVEDLPLEPSLHNSPPLVFDRLSPPDANCPEGDANEAVGESSNEAVGESSNEPSGESSNEPAGWSSRSTDEGTVQPYAGAPGCAALRSGCCRLLRHCGRCGFDTVKAESELRAATAAAEAALWTPKAAKALARAWRSRLLAALDACPNSPFALALGARSGKRSCVERSLMLANCSGPLCSAAAAALPDLGEALRRGHWLPRVVPMLALLYARATAEQTCPKQLLFEAAAWPTHTAAPDLTMGGRDGDVVRVEHESESFQMPPFVYVTESVPFDVIPQWKESSAKGGCNCCATTKGGGKDVQLYCSADTGTLRKGGGGCCRSSRTECSFGCACAAEPELCANRDSQLGQQKKLVVFAAGDKGWGVKADEHISKGEFVVEYLGEIISHAEAERRGMRDTYQFDLSTISGEGPYIDAENVRNVAAFINFSCAPNLEVRKLNSTHGDRLLPRVTFYAKCDIQPGEELGYRRDMDATTKRLRRNGGMPCYCGAKHCQEWT